MSTFGDILTAVCKDGINATRRSDAKLWVAGRHAMVWDAADWTFKRSSGAIVFTAGSQIAAGPADVHSVFAVYNAQGEPLAAYDDARRFQDRYNTLADASTGVPEAYTVYGGQILIGPKGDGSTGLVLYEKSKPSLVDDADLTGLPDGYDLGLIHGGKAEGFKLTNIPMADAFDADFTAFVNSLKNNWLEEVAQSGSSKMGAYRPGG